MLSGKKCKKSSVKLSDILLLMTALLLCLVSAAAAAEEGVPAVADPKTTPCKGLKPFNNLDELLYQFYINLDSDCLFKMPVAELEKVWKTKIASYKRSNSTATKVVASLNEDFWGKPYKIERDIFFIEAVLDDELNTESFIIKKTREYEAKEDTLLLNDYDYPEGFSKPQKTYYSGRNVPMIVGQRFPDSRPGKYRDNTFHMYYWVNSKQTRMIRLLGEFGIVREIEVHNYIHPAFIADINKKGQHE